MNNKLRYMNRKRGYILIVTLIISMLFFLIAIIFSSVISGSYKESGQDVYYNLSYYVAEAGINYMRGKMYNDSSLDPPKTYSYPSDPDTLVFSDGVVRGRFSVSIEKSSPYNVDEYFQSIVPGSPVYHFKYSYDVRSVGLVEKLVSGGSPVIIVKRTLRAVIFSVEPLPNQPGSGDPLNPNAYDSQCFYMKKSYEANR